jgi:glycosyltransferase involved in cell wall biosynthesis
VALPGPSPLAAEFARAGATLHVVKMRRLTTSGSQWRWMAYALAWPVSVLRLVALARRTQADVVHSNSLHSWYGWAVARWVRRPHVWHARELVFQSSAALRVERVLAKRYATVVVAMSKAIAAQLDPANVSVIYDQPDDDEFSPSRAGTFRKNVGIADDAVVVGSVSRIDTWKGVDVLVDAAATFTDHRPETQVVVAGPAVAGKEHYERTLARRAESIPGMHWLGPRADVADLLADLDVFVAPSTLAEPFGMVILEALASGVPVVSTDAGGPQEILATSPPSVGRLVPTRDANALAEATLALLPPKSSTEIRRNRSALPSSLPLADQPSWASLFEEVSAEPRPGRARRGLRRTPST